ncbi:hypothetical protein OTU49_006486, partial [Cherax quadricarinatus]
IKRLNIVKVRSSTREQHHSSSLIMANKVALSSLVTMTTKHLSSGMLDYMIWPWAERLPMVEMIARNNGVLTQDRFPKMLSWMDFMKNDAAVKVSFISPENHLKFINSHLEGRPDYDMEE